MTTTITLIDRNLVAHTRHIHGPVRPVLIDGERTYVMKAYPNHGDHAHPTFVETENARL